MVGTREVPENRRIVNDELIELLFKALKQNLKVKTFVGTSANALHTQIWKALIALLLLS